MHSNAIVLMTGLMAALASAAPANIAEPKTATSVASAVNTPTLFNLTDEVAFAAATTTEQPTSTDLDDLADLFDFGGEEDDSDLDLEDENDTDDDDAVAGTNSTTIERRGLAKIGMCSEIQRGGRCLKRTLPNRCYHVRGLMPDGYIGSMHTHGRECRLHLAPNCGGFGRLVKDYEDVNGKYKTIHCDH